MGNNNSHVAFESDDHEGITFVKGIRLSDKVIDRMRESPCKRAAACPAAHQPRPTPVPPAERLAPIVPPPPQFVSTLVPPPVVEPVPVVKPQPSHPLLQTSEEAQLPIPTQPVGLPATPIPPAEDRVTPTASATKPVAPTLSPIEPTASSSPAPLSEPVPPSAQAIPTDVPAEPASPSSNASSAAPPPAMPSPPPSLEALAETPKTKPEVVEPIATPVIVDSAPVSTPPVEALTVPSLLVERVESAPELPTVLPVIVEPVTVSSPAVQCESLPTADPEIIHKPSAEPTVVPGFVESVPSTVPEVMQKPSFEPTVLPVVGEPVPVSSVEPVTVSPAVGPESLPTPGPEVIDKPSVEPTAVIVESIKPDIESTPASAGPVAEPAAAKPLDTQVPFLEPTDIPTLPVEVIPAPAHSDNSVAPVSPPAEPVVTPTFHLEPVAVSSPVETTGAAAAAEVIPVSVPLTLDDASSPPLPCEPKDVPSISPSLEEVPTTLTLPPTEAVCTPSPVAPPTPIAEEIEAIAMVSSSTVPTSAPLLALEDHADMLPNSTAAPQAAIGLLALPAGEDSVPAPPEKPTEIHPIPSLLDSMSPPPQLPPPKTPVVNEDEVRTQIKGELQRLLEQEMSQAQLRIQKQLEEEKLKATALAQAAAQVQIQEQVKKVLDEKKAALQKSLKEAIMKERMNTEDERLIAQYYWLERKAQKLEERDEDLRKQDALYREQISKLEEKSALFYKVTSESFQKGKEDTHNRFNRVQIKPVCAELQHQIMKCYKDNQGQTLACSSIASLYIQCVDKAKQKTKTSIGG